METAAHFEHMRRRNLRDSTITQRRYVLARLERFTGRPAIEAGPEDLRTFLDRLSVPESRATELAHLRAFYRWATVEGYLDLDPTLRIERPRLHRRLPRPMPDRDLAHALAVSEDRVRVWLHLAAYAGLRAWEMAGLRAEGVLVRQTPPMLVVEAKGGKMRAIPMHPLLVPIVRDLPQSGWCFPRRDGNPGPVRAHVVSHAANGFLHDLGIAHTLHTIRHWFGTETYRATRDLRVTQELLGHESPVTTQLYTWTNPVDAVAAVYALRPPVEAPPDAA